MRRIDGWADGRIVLACLLSLSVYPPIRLSAQQAVRADSTHRVGPIGALWRSLVLPGWGQAVTGRNVTGAMFAAWEGTTIFMTLKAQQEADYFKAAGLPNLHSKRQEVQDWMVLWVFNHLFSGAEAFVAAHLRDFPKDLQLRAVPGGVGVSLPLPSR